MSTRSDSLLVRYSPFAISFAVTCLFFINFCNLIFQCGCRSLWAGADVACNIHAASGHHCPWCSHGVAGYAIEMILMCAPQLAISLARWTWLTRTLAAVAAFPVAGSGIALMFGWIDSYWAP